LTFSRPPMPAACFVALRPSVLTYFKYAASLGPCAPRIRLALDGRIDWQTLRGLPTGEYPIGYWIRALGSPQGRGPRERIPISSRFRLKNRVLPIQFSRCVLNRRPHARPGGLFAGLAPFESGPKKYQRVVSLNSCRRPNRRRVNYFTRPASG